MLAKMARSSALSSPAPDSFSNAHRPLHFFGRGTHRGHGLGPRCDSYPQAIAGLLPDGRVALLLSDWLSMFERDRIRAVYDEAGAQGSLPGAGSAVHRLCVI